MLRQVEAGLLDLDHDVAAYLRSWTLPDGAHFEEAGVTLCRLLSHTAGINVYGFGGVTRGGRLATSAEVLEGGAGTQAIRVESTPGERFRYSGGGYQIVQLLLGDGMSIRPRPPPGCGRRRAIWRNSPWDFAPKEDLGVEGWLLRIVLWGGALWLAGVAAWKWYARPEGQGFSTPSVDGKEG